MKILRNTFLYMGTLCSFYSNASAEMDVVLIDYEINFRSSYEIRRQPPASKLEEISLNIRSFEERAPGVFFPVNSHIDSTELEDLLKNPKVSFVVLDDRFEYKVGGDKKIQTNRDFIQNWYKKAKTTVGEHNIHKLVWLPKQKVVDDLMSRLSFIPEAWLLKMDSYYATWGSK